MLEAQITSRRARELGTLWKRQVPLARFSNHKSSSGKALVNQF